MRNRQRQISLEDQGKEPKFKKKKKLKIKKHYENTINT